METLIQNNPSAVGSDSIAGIQHADIRQETLVQGGLSGA